MWHDHSFSQRNKTTERAVGLGVGADREGREEGGVQILKKEGETIWGGLYKVGWVRTPLSTMLSKDKILRFLWKN